MKKKSCDNCRWQSYVSYLDGIPCIDIICKKLPKERNILTGEVSYRLCEQQSQPCKEWEHRRIIDIIKRLFI